MSFDQHKLITDSPFSVSFLLLFQTKVKSQIGTALDVEKYLSSSQIQDWRNSDLQRYKVRDEHCQQQEPLSIQAVCYVNHCVGSDCAVTSNASRVRV